MRSELHTRRFYLGRDYCEGLQSFGAIPFHLGLIPDKEYIAEALRQLDGVLLPGSDTDVDPLTYGEEPHVRLKKVVPEKEKTDLMVLEQAEKLKLPVLAICFGMQVLNVQRGGTLVQDIESQVASPVRHEQGEPLERNSHCISIRENSLLKKLAVNENGEVIDKVNSHHHQAINKTGSNLQATAWAKDKVIECIEDDRNDRFVLGVQWHPELSWRTDGLSRNIFKVFVEECVKYQRNK